MLHNLPYLDRRRLNTEQNFTVYFLNNFSIHDSIRTLWIHVTWVPFYSLDMNLQEYGKLYQYNNVYEFRFLYNTVFSQLIFLMQAVAYITRLVKIRSCISRFTVLIYEKRSYKCSICFRTYHAFWGERA